MKLSKQLVENISSLMARGGRMKRLREMCRLSAEEFARQLKISRQTVSYWENGKHNGLSYKGAQTCLLAFQKWGIECDLNWLWLGMGPEPYLISEKAQTSVSFASLDSYPEDIRLEEIKLFRTHPESVVMPVKHNAMRPLYQNEDWIGGYWQPLSPKFLEQPCIVNIANHLEIRFLKKISHNAYSLSFLTYQAGAMEPFELENQAIFQVAPVIRLWRHIE